MPPVGSGEASRGPARRRAGVAGGRVGDARVVDPDTGDVLASYDLAAEPESFVDDVTASPSRTNLIIVQNRANTVVELQINAAGSQGDIVGRITDERFDVPTTIADAGDLLYLPNARFGIEVTPDTEYEAVTIDRP